MASPPASCDPPGHWRIQGHGLRGLGLVTDAAFSFHSEIGTAIQEVAQFDATRDPGVDGHIPGGYILAGYLISPIGARHKGAAEKTANEKFPRAFIPQAAFGISGLAEAMFIQ